MSQDLETCRSVSPGQVASLIVKASKGQLLRVFGYNALAGAQFLQVHDSATLPADAAVPILVIALVASSPFQIDLNGIAFPFQNGITICNSSTGPTKTIGAANCLITALYK